MIDDIHIDDFCRDSALILLYLYRHFPRKATLYVEDIIGPEEQDEYGLHSVRHLSCLSTMIWMAEEGFIRYEDNIRQEALDQVVIAHATFLHLTSIHNDISRFDSISSEEINDLPESVKAVKYSNIAQINRALQSGSSHNVRMIMLDFFGESGSSDK